MPAIDRRAIKYGIPRLNRMWNHKNVAAPRAIERHKMRFQRIARHNRQIVSPQWRSQLAIVLEFMHCGNQRRPRDAAHEPPNNCCEAVMAMQEVDLMRIYEPPQQRDRANQIDWI